MTRTPRHRQSVAALLVIVAILLFTPTVAANDFIIENQTGTPILVANGTSNNVGIGQLNPASRLAVNGDIRGGVINASDALITNQVIRSSHAGGILFRNLGGGTMMQLQNTQNEVQIPNFDLIVGQGDTVVRNGILNMSGNNITDIREVQDFFAGDPGTGGGACPSGQFVQSINPDGSYTCDSASSGVSDEFVNRSGDSMIGQLNMTNNSINNISTLNAYGNRLRVGGTLDLRGNDLTSSSPFIDDGEISANVVGTNELETAAVTANELGTHTVNTTHIINETVLEADLNTTGDPIDGQFLTYDAGTGGFTWVNNPDTTVDQQNLSEVLVHGNRANMTIDMSTNNIVNVNALSVSQALSDGNISDSITVDGTGTVYDTALSDQGTLGFTWDDTEVADSITVGSNGRVDGAFVTVGDPLADGNISDSISIDNGPLYAQNGGAAVGIGTNSPSVLLTVAGDAQVQGDLDVWGNVTNTQVNEVSVNGSLLPPAKYNNTFNIGNSSNWWRDGYFGGDIRIAGTVDGVDIDVPGTGIEVNNNGLRISTGAAGDGLTGGGSQALAVNYDDTTITTDASQVLQVAANGISTNELANNAVGSNQVQPAAVNTTHIAASAVQNTDIANAAVNRTQLRQSGCGDEDVLKWNATSAQWECQTDADTNTDSQNLADVLSRGNRTNGQDIDMDGASVRSSGGEICIGDQCT